MVRGTHATRTTLPTSSWEGHQLHPVEESAKDPRQALLPATVGPRGDRNPPKHKMRTDIQFHCCGDAGRIGSGNRQKSDSGTSPGSVARIRGGRSRRSVGNCCEEERTYFIHEETEAFWLEQQGPKNRRGWAARPQHSRPPAWMLPTSRMLWRSSHLRGRPAFFPPGCERIRNDTRTGKGLTTDVMRTVSIFAC